MLSAVSRECESSCQTDIEASLKVLMAVEQLRKYQWQLSAASWLKCEMYQNVDTLPYCTEFLLFGWILWVWSYLYIFCETWNVAIRSNMHCVIFTVDPIKNFAIIPEAFLVEYPFKIVWTVLYTALLCLRMSKLWTLTNTFLWFTYAYQKELNVPLAA